MRPFRKALQILRFLGFYIGNVLHANFRLAIDILRPRMRLRPGFIKIPLKVESDFEILVYANLETMTPGTFVIDVSADREFLLVHSMYVSDDPRERQKFGQELQRQVLEVMR
ncbi:MAG TPA: Na+/H+ antiporter subunit E [Pseudobdellovibrionaceae bacterium]|nr:Na+/H+ antiporter subunit E [Pseudobdellovibrionaceae bacterium]